MAKKPSNKLSIGKKPPVLPVIPPEIAQVNLRTLKGNKPRDEKLSIQNNPDALPWIKNKVIKESLVGKRKSA